MILVIPASPVRRLALPLVLLLLLATPTLHAQRNFDTIQVRAMPVASHLYMLTGAGGNIGLSVGKDGAFLIDDQFAPLTDKIRAAVAEIANEPIRFVLNTHWHGDHTGGNENLGEAGATIVAHDNVRRRMSVEQFIRGDTVPASPEAALPVVTFDSEVTFHLNGDSVRAFHIAPAHTDGDAIVHFPVANVVHMGDTYFASGYPFVDLASGGSVDGVIAATERVLGMTNARTRIIPGHGPLSDRAALQTYHDMLVAIRNRIRTARAAGQTLEQVKAARPTAEFDAKWGGGFIDADTFVETVYRSLGS
ncbi:MBL fold metallo-hydrolase [soil metagenome]